MTMNDKRDYQEIQGILSIGYIFLILMGILNETLYYNQLGIEILTYSSILDVLISPISSLTTSISGFGLFIFFLLLIFGLPNYLAEQSPDHWLKKTFKFEQELSKKEAKNAITQTFIFMFSLGLIGFYVGTGIGKGVNLKKKMANNELTYEDHLVFLGGDSEKVEIIGKNSAYVFYLSKDNDVVKVTPISGTLKSIEEK